jgi:tuberous sclerosis protein 2
MLQTISFILSRDISLPVNWFMPNVLLSVADHLSDEDSSGAIAAITKRHGFSPTSPEWMETWDDILKNPNIFSGSKPLTWAAILGAVETIHSIIKDVPSYRKPWVESVLRFWKAKARSDLGDGAEVLWLVLGEEVVLRQVESGGEVPPDLVMDDILLFLAEMAVNDQAHLCVDSRSPSSDSSVSVSSTIPPSIVRQDVRALRKGGEHTLPSVMSILTTFATGSSSRSQSQNRRPAEEDTSEPTQDLETPSTRVAPPNTFTKSVGATLALILAFGQLSFTPHPAQGFDFHLLVRIFRVLLQAICSSTCQKARLTCLRFLMRLRADRDHKVYFAASGYDPDGHVLSMARVLNRVGSEEERADPQGAERGERGRPAEPLSQRHRGRALAVVRHNSLSKHSRSASRAPGTVIPQPLWQIPDILPFKVPFSDMPTKGVSSYVQTPSEEGGLLPVSEYLNIVVNLLSEEQDWEILSFVLCHLPVQLSHKHLFCGPKCRALMGQLLKTLCTGISTKEFGIKIHPWPEGLKPRDACGLAYHSLSVLISYKRCFDGQSLHHLIEVFLDGLSGSPSAIKCCLHALSLSAFELKPSITRYLSRILEKLSQIMSNPTMSVHIIDFLSIIGSIQSLHANFREQEYKMVFGVALQYLQQHNRQDSANQISWALSQHVRIMSYYIIYVWFLSLRLSDRPRHIPFICRQLLLANEGRAAVDQSTEVCFDWLARYSYASADPRPANSTFSDIITNPPDTMETAISEKTWVVGNSVVTIRTLSRLGWLEVVSRRASGLTKFLCRAENVPLVGPGDLDPDMLSIPASFMMERTQSSSDLIPKASSRLDDNVRLF